MEETITKKEEPKKKKYEDWEIEEAARTLLRAEEIKQDAELMKLAAPKLEKTVRAAASAAEILYGIQKGNNDENKSN